MRPRQPGTEAKLGNCTYAIGISAAMHGIRSVLSVMQSLDNVVEFESGRADTTKVLDGELLLDIPQGCTKCGSNDECYLKLAENDYVLRTR